MQGARDGDLVLAKLEDESDLLEGILEVCRAHGVESGAVVWAIGMVRDFELGYFNGREYERHRFEEPHEVVSLHGSVSRTADPPIHVHLGAAARDNALVGGHLFSARVSTLAEVCIRSLEDVRLGRALNPASGLRELTVEERPRKRASRKAGRGRRT